MAEHLLLAALLADLELDLAAQRRDDAGQVAHPGDRRSSRASRDQRGAPHRGGRGGLRGGDREPGGDAGAAVDRGRLADQPGEPRDDLDQVLGQVGARVAAVPGRPRPPG